MRVLIKFKNPLLRLTGSGWSKGGGWQPVGTGVVFPFEVVAFGSVKERTLGLMPPIRLEFGDDMVVLQWEQWEERQLGKTIGVSVPTHLIANLTMQWR